MPDPSFRRVPEGQHVQGAPGQFHTESDVAALLIWFFLLFFFFNFGRVDMKKQVCSVIDLSLDLFLFQQENFNVLFKSLVIAIASIIMIGLGVLTLSGKVTFSLLVFSTYESLQKNVSIYRRF